MADSLSQTIDPSTQVVDPTTQVADPSTQTIDPSTQMPKLEDIENTARFIFDGIVNGTEMNPEWIEKIILVNYPNVEVVDAAIVGKIIEVIQSFRTLLHASTKQYVVTETKVGKDKILQQSQVEATLCDLFGRIRENHCHTTKCKGVDHVCIFHAESLFCHSVLACVVSLYYYITTTANYEYEDARMIGATALLHDVGKLCAVSAVKIQENNVTKNATAFKGHALCGEMILRGMYTPQNGFSFDQWEIICRAVGVHMCGYHETNPYDFFTNQKWNHIALEMKQVKDVLICLSVGDKLGAIPHQSIYDKEIYNRFIISRNAFVKHCQKDPETVPVGTNLVVVVTGHSASGKTHFVNEVLVPYFDRYDVRYVIVRRDDIMVKLAASQLSIDLPPNGTYNGEIYARCFEHINQKNLMGNVDDEMRRTIRRAFQEGTVPIIDTVMGLYPRAFNSLFSLENLANSEIVQIIIDRQIPICQNDADRLGTTLETQLKIRGQRPLFVPFGKDMSIGSISSIMEGKKLERSYNNTAQPTFVFTIVRREDGIFGMIALDSIFPIILQKIKNQKPPPNTYNMNGIQYLQYIYDNIPVEVGMTEDEMLAYKVAAMIHHFEILAINMTPTRQFENDPRNRRFNIKYSEVCGNWSKWARDFRALFFRIDAGKIIPVKYQTPRGAELLTGMHVKNGISASQDITITTCGSKIARLHPRQQSTCNALLAGEGELDIQLTAKGDGSMISVTEYFGEERDLMYDIVMKSKDKYAIFVTDYIRNKYDKVVVISTQGTLMVGPDMWDYILTSLLDVTHVDRALYEKLSPFEALTKFSGPALDEISRILSDVEFPEGTLNRTFCFEAICSNRTSAWGTVHTELAVSYDISMFLYFGHSVCTSDQLLYFPHTVVNVKSDIYPEPPYWKFNDARQVIEIMGNLEKVLYGEMTVVGFLEQNPPVNQEIFANFKNAHSLLLHAEGFVVYTLHGADRKQADYNKLKAPLYYESHKWRMENIQHLLAASKSETARRLFPLVNYVHQFYADLNGCLIGLWRYVHNKMNDRKNTEIILTELPDKAKASFLKSPPEIKAKILFNNGTGMTTLILTKLIEIFPLLSSTSQPITDTLGTCARLATEFEFWKDPEDSDAVARFYERISTHPPILSNLFDAVMNQKPRSTGTAEQQDQSE